MSKKRKVDIRDFFRSHSVTDSRDAEGDAGGDGGEEAGGGRGEEAGGDVGGEAGGSQDVKKQKKQRKRADKVKPLDKPTPVEAIQKEREPIYFPMDEEDNVGKKCYLKKKSKNNFDKQEEFSVSHVLNEDSIGPTEVVMNLYSCTSLGNADSLCEKNEEVFIGGFSHDHHENLENYNSLHSKASDKMVRDVKEDRVDMSPSNSFQMIDSHEMDHLKEKMKKMEKDNAALEEILLKEMTEKALLQDALEKEKSSKTKLKMALKREKLAKLALEGDFDHEKSSTAALEKALAQEKSSTAALEKALSEEKSANAALEKALAQEKSANAALEKALSEEKSATAALEKTLHKKRTDNAALQKSLQKRKVVISDLQATLVGEQSNSAKVRLQVETMASELESCEKVKRQLSKNLEHSERKLEKQVEANDKMAQEKNKEIQKLQDHIIDLQKRHLGRNASQIQVQKLQQEVRAKDQELLSLMKKAKQMSADLIEEKNKSLYLEIDVAAAQSQQKKAEEERILLTHESKDNNASLVAQKAVVAQLQQRLDNDTKHTSALMTQVWTLGEAVRAKDELLALKDQRINQLRSELFERKSRIY